MNREKIFLKSSLILSIGTIMPKIVSLITLPIVTGYLIKSDYGTYDLIIIIASLFLPAVTLEMQAAAFRFLIQYRNDINKTISIITNILLFITITSVTALIIIFCLLTSVDSHLRINIIIFYLIDSLLIALRQIARGLSYNAKYSISAILSSVFEMVFMAIFLKGYRFGLNGAISALSISQLISLIYLFFAIKIYKYIKISMVNKEQIKEMLEYSWPLVPNALSSWIIRVSDRFVISIILGLEANAIYSVANKIPTMFGVVQSTFSLAWQENASISVADEDSGKYYGKMFTCVYNLMAGILSLSFAITPIAFKILIRGSYDAAYSQIPILYFGIFFSMLSSYLGGIYIAHKKSKTIGVTTVIAAIINLSINLLFVKVIGIYAASISTLIAYVWLTIYRMRDIQKIHKIDFNIKHMTKLILVLIAFAIICFINNSNINIMSIFASTIFAFLLNRQSVKSMFKILTGRT